MFFFDLPELIYRLEIIETFDIAGTLGAAVALALSKSEGETAIVANQQTVLRFLCNCFRSTKLRGWLLSQTDTLFSVTAEAISSPQKTVRGAATAFLLNMAIYAKFNGLPSNVLQQILTTTVSLQASLQAEDEESAYRWDPKTYTICVYRVCISSIRVHFACTMHRVQFKTPFR